jgi:hypothetical protein
MTRRRRPVRVGRLALGAGCAWLLIRVHGGDGLLAWCAVYNPFELTPPTPEGRAVTRARAEGIVALEASAADHAVHSPAVVGDANIRAPAGRIAAEFWPGRIILFGSRAAGRAGEDSDGDRLGVLALEGSPLRESVEILDRVNPRFAVDLLGRTPADAPCRYDRGDPLLRGAFDRGVVLDEAAA